MITDVVFFSYDTSDFLIYNNCINQVYFDHSLK